MNQGFVGWSVTRSSAPAYINIQDQKAQNTTGGASAAAVGSWATRTLNTIVNDTAGIASLVSNQVTLPAGIYRVCASVPAFGVDIYQSRLQNMTDGTTILTGTSERAANADNTTSRSWITGIFQLTAAKAIAVQEQCQTNYVNGFGSAANFTIEVYTVLEIWKLA